MQTLFIGKNLIFLSEVTSTNSYAIDLLKNVNPAEGTVIRAEHQTQGRGQRGALWQGDSGQNLAASVILNPRFLSVKDQFYLYQIAALACYDTITELLKNGQFDIKIKWPNDILLDQKKIAGILIENGIQNNLLNYSVIGIGLNVNQINFEGLKNVTSFRNETLKRYDLTNVLECLCKNLEKHYLALVNSKFDLIKTTYMKHLIGKDNFMEYEIAGEKISFKIKGISEEGLLMLEDRQGKEKIVDVKEARLIYGK